jgi:hypothetical protein
VNSINVIAPYRYLGMWVFDDARVGLVQEPFVGGADTMIDRIVADIPDASNGFIMVFSAGAFPAYRFRLEWRRPESGGNVYYSADLDAEGWLCPALFRYFDAAPPEIYVQVKAKEAERAERSAACTPNFQCSGCPISAWLIYEIIKRKLRIGFDCHSILVPLSSWSKGKRDAKLFRRRSKGSFSGNARSRAGRRNRCADRGRQDRRRIQA